MKSDIKISRQITYIQYDTANQYFIWDVLGILPPHQIKSIQFNSIQFNSIHTHARALTISLSLTHTHTIIIFLTCWLSRCLPLPRVRSLFQISDNTKAKAKAKAKAEAKAEANAEANAKAEAKAQPGG